jgi:hypothetical protein
MTTGRRQLVGVDAAVVLVDVHAASAKIEIATAMRDLELTRQ